MQLYRIIFENVDSATFTININDVEKMLKLNYISRDVKFNLEFLADYYPDNKQDIDHIFEVVSKMGQRIIDDLLARGVPHVDVEGLKVRFLEMNLLEYSVDNTWDDLYPIPVYVSSSPEDEMTIGLLYHKDGKLEMFEGNGEATDETITLVNKLLNPKGKEQKIYASHGIDVVKEIEKTGILPKNLYVSPRIDVAETYWDIGKERLLFTGVVNINDLSQESETDWKTVGPAKIEKFKILRHL